MKFIVSKSSDSEYIEEVEINTLEEFKEYQRKHKYPDNFRNVTTNPSLIVNFESKTIEVYDYFRE